MVRRHSLIARILALAGVPALVLAGCAGNSKAAGDGGPANEGTVHWWSWTPDNDLAEREIAAFNRQYPNIKVIYKKVPNNDYTAVLRPALASEDGPDVFTVSASGTTGAVGVFASYALDLTPKTEELLGKDWQSKVDEQSTKAFSKDGKLAAFPWAKVAAGNMWINQGLFDKYHLKPPKTLAEWTQVCKTFRANGLGCLKEGAGAGFDVDTFHSIVNSVQPGLFLKAAHGEAKWTDPGIVEAYRIFGQLEGAGILDPGAVGIQQYPDVNNAFLSGKVPMVQMGSWYAQYATVDSLQAALAGAGVPANTPKITIAPIAFPDVAGKGNPSTVFADPDAAQAVNAKSKVRNAATTFALWLGGSKEGQAAVSNNVDSLPTLKGVTADWDSIKLVNPTVQKPLLVDLYKQAAETTESRTGLLPAVNVQALLDANQAVLTHKQSPEQAAASVQKVFDANPVSG
ncbi:extracellular solute-binding protein [Kribbella solani]|uniref:ABC-type glycerol-3-phosphate transport system substrate-binding protein n=1 Tax=Kribbella solani TaxID=236067 RepID=A0A841DHG9_9ACTN|nr:ABC-type glycerol-3-phosphate transport system substrate-binding protein [Kribbella solani]